MLAGRLATSLFAYLAYLPTLPIYLPCLSTYPAYLPSYVRRLVQLAMQWDTRACEHEDRPAAETAGAIAAADRWERCARKPARAGCEIGQADKAWTGGPHRPIEPVDAYGRNRHDRRRGGGRGVVGGFERGRPRALWRRARPVDRTRGVPLEPLVHNAAAGLTVPIMICEGAH